VIKYEMMYSIQILSIFRASNIHQMTESECFQDKCSLQGTQSM
jgi:hypothetical protein